MGCINRTQRSSESQSIPLGRDPQLFFIICTQSSFSVWGLHCLCPAIVPNPCCVLQVNGFSAAGGESVYRVSCTLQVLQP